MHAIYIRYNYANNLDYTHICKEKSGLFDYKVNTQKKIFSLSVFYFIVYLRTRMWFLNLKETASNPRGSGIGIF